MFCPVWCALFLCCISAHIFTAYIPFISLLAACLRLSSAMLKLTAFFSSYKKGKFISIWCVHNSINVYLNRFHPIRTSVISGSLSTIKIKSEHQNMIAVWSCCKESLFNTSHAELTVSSIFCHIHTQKESLCYLFFLYLCLLGLLSKDKQTDFSTRSDLLLFQAPLQNLFPKSFRCLLSFCR